MNLSLSEDNDQARKFPSTSISVVGFTELLQTVPRGLWIREDAHWSVAVNIPILHQSSTGRDVCVTYVESGNKDDCGDSKGNAGTIRN